MAGEELFCKEWEKEVTEALLCEVAKPRNALSVPSPLLNAKPEAYNPKIISLGPYHFSKVKDVSEGAYSCDEVMILSKMEGGKIKSAATLLQLSAANKAKSAATFLQLSAADKAKYADTNWQFSAGDKVKFAATQKLIQKDSERLNGIVEEIKNMREKIKRFYDWSMPEVDQFRNNFGLMMAVDSLFLLHFLFDHDRGERLSAIKCDILKLGNQIPLFVLEKVFVAVKEALPNPNLYRDKDEVGIKRFLAETAYRELSPFDMIPSVSALSEETLKSEESHLLGCSGVIVSEFLQIKRRKREPTLFKIISNFLVVHVVERMCSIFLSKKHREFPNYGYTARELAKSGIKFKSFSKASHHIWFDEYSHTLYLPRMTVSAPLCTEVFFRNLLALEFNNSASGNHVERFIQLMDSLIDSGDDVCVLRKSHVICPQSALPDQYIANIWHNMSQPLNFGHHEPPKELKEALDKVLTNKYHMIKIRMAFLKVFDGWSDQYLSKPWNVIGLLVGIFILVMNSIQAYCSLWGCHFHRSN